MRSDRNQQDYRMPTEQKPAVMAKEALRNSLDQLRKAMN